MRSASFYLALPITVAQPDRLVPLPDPLTVFVGLFDLGELVEEFSLSSALSPNLDVVTSDPALSLCLTEATQVILVPPVEAFRIRPEDTGDITNAYRLLLDQFLEKNTDLRSAFDPLDSVFIGVEKGLPPTLSFHFRRRM